MAEQAPEEGIPDSQSVAKTEDAGGAGEVKKKKSASKAEKIKVEAKKKEKKRPNCCQRCCSSMMRVVAHDAIYGSFFGPHPVSFLCFCVPCKKSCDADCTAPFSVSSIATKTMYLIMLGVVSLLAAFFIVPWPETALSHKSLVISSFWPCDKSNKMRGWEHINGGCIAHAGYFMAYRCFMAFATLMFINSHIMVYVTNTDEDESRAKIHRGFWFYKYLALTGLMFVYFFISKGEWDPHGVFEFTVSIIGNVAHVFFSFLIIACIMDVAEAWVVENRTSNSKWANILYWTFTMTIATFDLVFFCSIVWDFSMKRSFGEKGNDLWPKNNCVEGSRWPMSLEWLHVILMCVMFGLIMLVMLVLASVQEKSKKRFPYLGWMQFAVFSGFNIFYLWSALYSSNRVNSRPRCNWMLYRFLDQNHTKLQSGSFDVYSRPTGAIHGLLIIFTLIYYIYIHGPRTKTAPFSILFRYIWGEDNKVPVVPEGPEAPQEFLDAVANLNVWDDEKEEVVYSWSKFYIILALGSLSLMMAATNFTNPWTLDKYNSSYHALWFKFMTAVLLTVVYIFLLLFPCSRIFPGFRRKRKIKKLKVTVDANDEENILDSELIEEEDDEEEEEEVIEEVPEVVEVRRVSSTPTPQKCGCLM